MDDRSFNKEVALERIETIEGEKSRNREADLYTYLRASMPPFQSPYGIS